MSAVASAEEPVATTGAPHKIGADMETSTTVKYATADHGAVRPTKLFIGGISRHTTTKQLRDHFSQVGRVLDCVAMRQPDGRSRGFGYVTLSSPLSADSCLRQPQVIDGRVVDMKLAVPGGSAKGSDMSQLSYEEQLSRPMDEALLSGGDYGYPYSGEPHVPYTLWSEGNSAFPGSLMSTTPKLGAATPTPFGAPALWWGGRPGVTVDSVDLLHTSHPAVMCDPASVSSVAGTTVAVCHTLEEPRKVVLHPAVSTAPMSANAPEFVPQQTRGVAYSTSANNSGNSSGTVLAGPVPVGKVTTTTALTATVGTTTATTVSNRRRPLGELTNKVQFEPAFDSRKGKQVATKVQVLDQPSQQQSAPMVPRAGGTKQAIMTPVSRLNIMTDLDDDADAITVPNTQMLVTCQTEPLHEAAPTVAAGPMLFATAPPKLCNSCQGDSGNAISTGVSEEVSDGTDIDDDVEHGCLTELDTTAAAAQDFPSAGSALHASGECRRCNFFPKGRCQNGKDCTFCHLPHEKRKPSRQEKRERQAAWLQEQTARADNLATTGSFTRHTLDTELANEVSVSRGGTPLSTSPGQQGKLSTLAASAPPGLAPPPPPVPPFGMLPWHEEATEVSPLYPAYGLQTCYNLSSPSSHAVDTVAPAPVATSALRFGTHNTNKAQIFSTMPPSPTNPMAMPTKAAPVPCTVEPQSSWEITKMIEHSGLEWSREDLLRIRGAMEAIGSLGDDALSTREEARRAVWRTSVAHSAHEAACSSW